MASNVKGSKIQIVWLLSVENFKNFEIHLHFVCQLVSQPASQPAVRPTSGRSTGPAFSHNAEY